MEISNLFGEAGLTLPANQMENGELRFRMMAPDGSGYIRTVAGQHGGWQNAHYHEGVIETYVVQSGWMGFVQGEAFSSETMEVEVFMVGPNTVITTEPRRVHNVYLPSGAVTHTIKHGTEVPNPEKGADWYAAHPAFDTWSKQLLEEDIREYHGAVVIIPLT